MPDHCIDLVHRHAGLAPCVSDIRVAADIMAETFLDGGTVYICGNGGSSADADHWTSELLKGFERPRSLKEKDAKLLPPDLAQGLCGGLRCVSLGGFTAFSSAWGNDANAVMAYAQLVWTLGRPGDALIGISTSGMAKNVLYAMDAACAKGMRRIGLSGVSGGDLAARTEVCIRVPETRTPHVQEGHVAIYHCISRMLEDRFFAG